MSTSRSGPLALPYGVFCIDGDEPRVGVRLGDQVIDLAAVAAAAASPWGPTLAAPSLDPLLAAGAEAWDAVRHLAETAAADDGSPRFPVDDVDLRLPFTVADYVDFYASADHAANVGEIFRGSRQLPQAWRHLPIGYHGRAGSVQVSGSPVVRPRGQVPTSGGEVELVPSAKLDLECELGFVIGGCDASTTRVSVSAAERHVFGVVILNDWSARDVQSFEYVPLGPFLGKSFATSVSAWVLPWSALQTARVDLPRQDPAPLPHLQGTSRGLDIRLSVAVNGEQVAAPPSRHLYWSVGQMIAHLTSNGAVLRDGDLLGSGTISGPEPGSCGSLLELTSDGRRPLNVAGRELAYLADGDEVEITGHAVTADGQRVELGDVTGQVLPSV